MKTWMTVKEAAPVLKMSEQGLYCAVQLEVVIKDRNRLEHAADEK